MQYGRGVGEYSRAFERGQVDYAGFNDKLDIMTYESNIAYTLRFMVDTQVRATWSTMRTGRAHTRCDRSSG